ncbi:MULTISPECIES: hypothetical protein [unclassified Pseudomonas]|uniref:hypothetical protein n=1 Tax=unclassified Pseudomonas TaxID=196821 RepID=UPI0011A333E5|nr:MULTISPECIES: hypothetical protein [unclassified Pseudomonas]TWC12305.1 hypothetical protein FBY00_12687 [Pseudomonas sp. SJZ075]TWC28820.1 hypothetical protein FBY02_12787 [Pseudomonas sp. SJZ078]TWC49069.1 hypothetical protein FBY11_12687 [Pseudomonas sp. SJZ124]TWC84645.1 hypothetical protein FBY09_12687 [Pseudomonas sp. SJZ101]
MNLSLQDITSEQADALKKQSQAAYDVEVEKLQALHQNAHPQTLAGLGSRQGICGYFNFQSGDSSNGSHTEVIQISASSAMIGPDAPQQGIRVRFAGHATGTGTHLNISNLYLLGTVPDAENLIGVQLTLQLSISAGSIKVYISEGTRLQAVLVHPEQSPPVIDGEFSGSGVGTFTQA